MITSKNFLFLIVLCVSFSIAGDHIFADLRLPPAPTLFLPYVVKVMQTYHEQHGEYAREWRLLDFEYDQERPKQQNKESFQNSSDDYVYKIVSADRNHFLIQALAWDDQVAYEIKDGMKEAVRLPGADQPPRLHPELPEPAHFLPLAAAAMRDYHEKYKRYPREWVKLEIVYSAVAFRPYNLHVHPQANDGEVWRPRGCQYIYRIVIKSDDHFLIQAETDSVGGEIKYEIRDGMKEAKYLEVPR